MTSIRVDLHAFPPLSPHGPSAALGYIKGYLNRHLQNSEVRLVHWNQTLAPLFAEVTPIPDTTKKITNRQTLQLLEFENLVHLSFLGLRRDHRQDDSPGSSRPWIAASRMFLESADGPRLLRLVSALARRIDEEIDAHGCAAADVVGCTAEFDQLLPALAFFHLLKERNSGCITVLGGRWDEATAQAAAEAFHDVDVCVYGHDGEAAFLEICERRRHGGVASDIAGTVVRTAGRVAANGPRPVTGAARDDCADYSGFDWHAAARAGSGVIYLPVRDSWGCAWSGCAFCNRPDLDGHGAQRSADDVLRDVSRHFGNHPELHDMPVRICLSGSLSCGSSRENLVRLLQGLCRFREDHPRVSLFAFFSPLQADDHVMSLLNRVTAHVAFGMEQLNGVLQRMGKPQEVEDNIRCLKLIEKYPDVEAHLPILFGFPGETLEDYQELADTLERLRFLLPNPRLAFTPIPVQAYQQSIIGREFTLENDLVARTVAASPHCQLLQMMSSSAESARRFFFLRYPLEIGHMRSMASHGEAMYRRMTDDFGRRYSISAYPTGSDTLCVRLVEGDQETVLEFDERLSLAVLQHSTDIVSEEQLHRALETYSAAEIDACLQEFVDLKLIYRNVRTSRYINTLPCSVQEMVDRYYRRETLGTSGT